MLVCLKHDINAGSALQTKYYFLNMFTIVRTLSRLPLPSELAISISNKESGKRSSNTTRHLSKMTVQPVYLMRSFRRFLDLAEDKPALQKAIEAVTRRCPPKSSRSKKEKKCYPGRLQVIEESLAVRKVRKQVTQ
jgi:hypothetical protein